MAKRAVRDQIDFVLRRHYSAAFTAADRACLIKIIEVWDQANSDAPMDVRRQRWLEIAREHVGAHWDAECVRVGG